MVLSSPSTDSLGTSATPSQNVVSKWKRGARAARMYAQATSNVSTKNKIGTAPTGWYRDVAMLLQEHVAEEGRAAVAVEGRAAPATSAPSSTPMPSTRPPGVWEAPAENLFKRVRQACGYSPARYYATLGLQDGQKEPTLRLLGASSAAGRSGAFFFLTPDQQFFVKTCTKKDWMTLLRILEDYVKHVEGAREVQRIRRDSTDITEIVEQSAAGFQGFVETLLPRYLGLYRFQTEAGGKSKPIRVVIMTNVFAAAETIDRRYDLKGSTHGRVASKKELAKVCPVLKDLDFQASENPLRLDPVTRSKLMQTLREDTVFLEAHGLIDYSLLIGVHDRSEDQGRKTTEGMLVTTVSDDTRSSYVGVVDILTPYLARKKAETFFLGKLTGRDISCQPPRVYAKRFLRFIGEHAFHELAEEDVPPSRSQTPKSSADVTSI